MLKHASVLAASLSLSLYGFAPANLELTTEMVGNSCEVTNETQGTVQVTQVKFFYSCEDSVLRKAPLRAEETLAPGESVQYPFPGPEGGCMLYFVHYCKATGEAQ